MNNTKETNEDGENDHEYDEGNRKDSKKEHREANAQKIQ